jgi:hypothetical protein
LRGLVSSLIALLMLILKCWWYQGSSLKSLYHDDYDDIEMAWHKWSDGVAKKSHPRSQAHIFVSKLIVTTLAPRRMLIVNRNTLNGVAKKSQKEAHCCNIAFQKDSHCHNNRPCSPLSVGTLLLCRKERAVTEMPVERR